MQFSAARTQADIHQRAAAWRLSDVRRIDMKGSHFLIAAPPGLASIDAANAIHESGDVLLATPSRQMEV